MTTPLPHDIIRNYRDRYQDADGEGGQGEPGAAADRAFVGLQTAVAVQFERAAAGLNTVWLAIQLPNGTRHEVNLLCQTKDASSVASLVKELAAALGATEDQS